MGGIHDLQCFYGIFPFYGLFILAIQLLLFLYSIKNKNITKRFLIAFSAIFFLTFPLIPRSLTVFSSVSFATWIPQPTFLMLVGTFFQFSNMSLVSFMLFVILTIGVIKIPRDCPQKLSSTIIDLVRLKFKTGSFPIVLCLLWLCFPIVLSFVFSLVIQPIYLPQYLILVSPAVYLFIAKGLTTIK